MKHCLWLFALGLVCLTAGCGDESPANVTGRSGNASGAGGLSGKLTLTGSSTVAPLVGEIGKRFEELNPGVRVDVQTGGSSRGIADATSGLADVGMASRALKDSESHLNATTIALDGIAVIVHADNPVAELTRQQVIDIYTGKINDWSEIEGARPGSITVVNKAEGRSTLELFLGYFALENPRVQADVVIGDNQQGIKQIAGNAGAIGYVSIGAAEFSASDGVPIRLLPMGGVPASIRSVKSGAFPLSRPLNLVTTGEVSPLTQAFLDFASSLAVNDLVEGQYFVPIAE